jgi:multimeric flavodoxin WrbA
MKAIGISSSGRKSAYSKIIVRDILEESGVECEMIHLSELNIKGCLGCLKCAGDNRCIQKDDFQAVVDKINAADALVFGGGNYYGMLNAIGHAFWERTFSLRHRETFPFAGKLGIAVGLDRDKEKREATRFIEKMMLSNKMAVIATYTDSGHQQCYDCGYGHNCAVGNVYAHMGLVDAAYAESNRPEEYGSEAQKEAKALGKMLGSILKARFKHP